MYEVGQVLFVLDEERHRIIPVQVVTETVRKTLDGAQVTYEIVTPAKPDRPVTLDQIKGQVFDQLDELHQLLLANTKAAVDRMVARAASVATDTFGAPEPAEEALTAGAHFPTEEVSDVATVTLPDGTVAKVSLPDAAAPIENGVVQNGVSM